MWFPTIWIYLVPFSFATELWKQPVFWIGLFFVTFPLNYLVYGLNDYNDTRADALNKRKGNFLFGASYSRRELGRSPFMTAMVIAPFFILFSILSGCIVHALDTLFRLPASSQFLSRNQATST